MDALIQQFTSLIGEASAEAAYGESSSGQSLICPRDLIVSTLRALQSAQDEKAIVKPSAWATRERELIRTIEKQKTELEEARTHASSNAESVTPPSLAHRQRNESERMVKKLTRERDELLAKVQQLVMASKQSRHHSPAARSSPSHNAAAADQAAQSSGLVVVEHLSVSRSRQLLQQRVDESKEQADKAIRMSAGGSRNDTQNRSYAQRAVAGFESTSPSPSAEFSPEKSPEAVEECDDVTEDESSPTTTEKIQKGSSDQARDKDEDEEMVEEESCDNKECAQVIEEEEELSATEEDSAVDAAMKALVAAAEVQQRMMEEEEEREKERAAERQRLQELMQEEAATRAAAEEEDGKDSEHIRQTCSAPPFSLDGKNREIEDLKMMVKGLDDKIRVYEATLQSMRSTVEAADDERHLLREQNLHLASTLAEMQAFISHRAKDKKSSSVSIGSWLKKRDQQQLPVSTGGKM